MIHRVTLGAAAAVLIGAVAVLALAVHSRSSTPAPAKPDIPTLGPATWNDPAVGSIWCAPARRPGLTGRLLGASSEVRTVTLWVGAV